MKPMTTLPNKAYEMIRLGIKDLKAVSEDPQYEVDMGCWLRVVDDKCMVCLAGAVLAKTLSVVANEDGTFLINSIHPRERDKILSLDMFRRGYINEGFARFHGENYGYHHSPMHITPYETDKEQFFQDLELMADILEQEEL